jgi:hypothetical protein
LSKRRDERCEQRSEDGGSNECGPHRQHRQSHHPRPIQELAGQADQAGEKLRRLCSSRHDKTDCRRHHRGAEEILAPCDLILLPRFPHRLIASVTMNPVLPTALIDTVSSVQKKADMIERVKKR